METYPMERSSGILMPIFSLPGGYGMGSLGKASMDFLKFLHKAGQQVWQILPVGPTGYGDSPYQCCSAFAGNPYMLDLDLLAKEGLLRPADYKEMDWGSDPLRVDYAKIAAGRLEVLRKAYARWKQRRPVPGYDTWHDENFNAFCLANGFWLEDYALYMTAKGLNGGKDWQSWPKPLRTREPEALALLKAENADEYEFWRFIQFKFDCQWQAVKEQAGKLGIRILGDMPIYVAADSADAWAGSDLFQTDAEGRPVAVAGCPPDFFSEDGQLWGNPLYDWERHKATGYAWWISRMRHALYTYDLVRIDHFRGFDTYWRIPASAKTAREGKWMQGPGMELFHALHKAIGPLPVVAEDLGEMFDSVRELLKESGFPGMKVLQFGFSDPHNEFLPHNHIPNSVVYPGTHDNTTIKDWLEKASSPAERKLLARYVPEVEGESRVKAMIRVCQASCSKLCVVPLQDWLELGAEGRINTPGVLGNNWNWRCRADACTPALAKQIAAMTELYGRDPR